MRMQLFLRSITLLLAVANFCYADEYSISVNNVGIGNNWRPGDVTPLYVTVTSKANEPTQAWLQWEVPDADGDLVLWGRALTIAPMGSTQAWLYAPTHGWDTGRTVWTLRLRELVDNVPTGELGLTRFSPQSVGASTVSNRSGLIAVCGTRRLGLAGYLPTTPEVKHENTLIVSGLNSSGLPDAWPSYEYLEALVWADATPKFTFRQEQSIEEWVLRGGHFVISLPSIGDPWALGSQSAPLVHLTEGVQVSVTELPLQALLPILGRTTIEKQMNVTVRVFGNIQDTWYPGVTPLIWLEDGTVIAVQKMYGFGAVTIIGVDLTNGQLASLGLPKTSLFWNPILGKRTETPSAYTLQTLQVENRLSPSIPVVAILSAGKMIAHAIAMSTTAGGKLGTAFLLIIAYWLIGGPLGMYVLHKRKKRQWSWVFFVATACVFTLVTWFLATSTSRVSIPLQHVSVIDHVYGGNGQRVNGWFSLFLPQFGNAEIELDGSTNNLLLPWSPPNASMTPDFIDKREVTVNIDQVPHTFDQPSRATTANFSYQWIGGIEHPYYNSLIRIVPEHIPNANQQQLQGAIVNNASSTIHDVTIIWVSGERATKQINGSVLRNMYAWRVPTWASGESIDFSSLKANDTSAFANAVNYRYGIEDRFGVSNLSPKVWRTKMEMLSLYSHLTPPVYRKKAEDKQGPASHHSIREGGRALDLSMWFSRPCIIVMGFMQNAPIPVEISRDGDEILESQGTTMIRWVYPLEQSR
jgi:hypothetical protein